MTDDLVKRLRRDLASGLSASIGDTEEAADRIEKLEQQLLTTATFLEDALGRIDIENPAHSIWGDLCGFVVEQSKEVMEKKQ